PLPWGAIEATLGEGRGLSAARCEQAAIEIRFRQGGERFRPAGRRHSTTLKRLLQGTAMPPWLRDRVPLVYVDDELAAVAGVWVGASHAAEEGEAGWLLRWTALPPAA
nr:tRNA lysidine(34) synthetase TilS [Gammaproteobacteria bacterium]